MSDQRWDRVKEIADQALDRDPDDREAFLDEACGADHKLRGEVDSLLSYEAESFLERTSSATTGAVGASAEGLEAGTQLGPYEVLAPIGSGGMGEVYRAHDSRLERDVAVKVLPASDFSDPAARGRLLREARSAAGLNHPHICTVYDVGESLGRIYVAMEVVEGKSLASLLANGPLPTEEAVRYATQLADALDHAHAHGVVHRDLKSANVVITSTGRAKVLDFGLAKRMRETELEEASSRFTLTQPGTVMGTLAYMAPEQLRGEAVDARTDIWALGVVAYEMVVGERPFGGSTGFQVSSAILSRMPLPLPASASMALRAVIERCLEKDRARRYPDAAQLRTDLESLQMGTSAAQTWAGLRYVASKRRALLAGIGLAMVTAAIVGLDAFGVRERLFSSGAPGGQFDSLVVLPLSNLSGDPEQEFIADGMTEALIAELSKLEGVGVVSRTSAMQYKGADKALRDIVQELAVDGAIEGGVVREGDLVRANISLIDGRTERSVWAQSFEREARGILALHGEMARAIADSIQLTLSPEEEALLASARPVDPEAYEDYLKGRVHWYEQTPIDVDRAQQYFQSALEKDPDFALAHLGMAYVWTYYASVGLLPPGETREKVIEAVRAAVEIDPNLAEVYEGEADYAYYYDWNWESAERNYRRAVELKPNSADMRLFYWDFLSAMKRPDEAEAQIQKCLELDPLNSYVLMNHGLFLLDTRRFEEAIVRFQDIVEGEMDFGPAHLGLWRAYHHLGRYDEAFASAKEYFTKWGDDEMAEALDTGFLEGGYRGAMSEVAETKVEASEIYYVLAIEIAQLFAFASDVERTLHWLEQSFEARDTGLVKVQVDPDWDLVRDEPRFQELVRRMEFPPT